MGADLGLHVSRVDAGTLTVGSRTANGWVVSQAPEKFKSTGGCKMP